MTTVLRTAINEALKHLEGEAHENLKNALWNEGKNQEIEDAKEKGWSMNLEHAVGERVNPKVFSGKRVYNNWMTEGGIHVSFWDNTAYEITLRDRLEIKRVR